MCRALADGFLSTALLGKSSMTILTLVMGCGLSWGWEPGQIEIEVH